MIALNNFEKEYISVRQRENRLYSDGQVKLLPEIERSHPHHQEWQIRSYSCRKLVTWLANKKRKLDILEVGCGNGWLCSQLSKITTSKIKGIDINQTELAQAKRVFGHIQNLEFLHAEIVDQNIRNQKFDAIIFAASIQYFPSLNEILPIALELLSPQGEIHIFDSHFYKPSEMNTARERSADYYRSIQFSEMSKYYFHHCIDELKSYRHKILYNPGSIVHRITKNKNPFPWICIYRNA